MSPAPLDPIPQSDPLIDASDHMNERWYRWLSLFVARTLSGVLLVAKTIHRTGLASSLGATTVYTPTMAGVLVRMSFRARITTAAAVSSSLTVTINWTEGGVAQSHAFAAMTGNTTATTGGDSWTIRPDPVPVTYTTIYASNPGGTMVYDLDVAAEALT